MNTPTAMTRTSRPTYSARPLLASLLLAALVASGCSMMAKPANTVAMGATLYAAAEVPPNASTAKGTLEASFNKETSVLTWTVTYSGLTGPLTAAHFHGPAAVGQNAGVVVPFGSALDSPIQGTATLTPAQVADLTSGKWYVNLHTAAHKGGEIRGQVVAK